MADFVCQWTFVLITWTLLLFSMLISGSEVRKSSYIYTIDYLRPFTFNGKHAYFSVAFAADEAPKLTEEAQIHISPDFFAMMAAKNK